MINLICIYSLYPFVYTCSFIWRYVYVYVQKGTVSLELATEYHGLTALCQAANGGHEAVLKLLVCLLVNVRREYQRRRRSCVHELYILVSVRREFQRRNCVHALFPGEVATSRPMYSHCPSCLFLLVYEHLATCCVYSHCPSYLFLLVYEHLVVFIATVLSHGCVATCTVIRGCVAAAGGKPECAGA